MLGDGLGQVGVDAYGVIDAGEGVEEAEGRLGEHAPLRLGEGVEGLAAEVGGVEARDLFILAVGGSWVSGGH